MPKKEILGSVQAVLMLLDLDFQKLVYPKEFYVSKVHHQNGLIVGKAAKVTVVAALTIWEKTRICEVLC